MGVGDDGLLSDLVLVRLHRKSADYLRASDEGRREILRVCRARSTALDLPRRILTQSIYSQSACRHGPLRELLQNAFDASPVGSRIDIRLSADHRTLTVVDPGAGMTRRALVDDLLVPFGSSKTDRPDQLGEHGIGFFSVLQIAPRIEIVTSTGREAHRLLLLPIGTSAPFGDFFWSIRPIPLPWRDTSGTRVRLELAEPMKPTSLRTDLKRAVSFVDPATWRVHLNDALINTARSSMHRAARAPIRDAGGCFGDLELFVGRVADVDPRILLTQAGILVAPRPEVFEGRAFALHRDLARALSSAGFCFMADLPRSIPLNKGRSAVAASASAAVDRAVVSAFEQFILEDAFCERALFRHVDHRLASVLDRLLEDAFRDHGTAGSRAAESPAIDVAAPRDAHAISKRSAQWDSADADSQSERETEDALADDALPSLAPPPEVVRFASALLDAPIVPVLRHREGNDVRHRATLREIVELATARRLRSAALGTPLLSGLTYLPQEEPLCRAVWLRLVASSRPKSTSMTAVPPPDVAESLRPTPRRELFLLRGRVHGIDALLAALTVLECIDGAISFAAGLRITPILVHQSLYGPDEMAHTDGTGISIHFGSSRVRNLLRGLLESDDPVSFAALVDLMLHEKAHASLSSYATRSSAEHGQSFYRKKDSLRRQLLEAIGKGIVRDPFELVASARQGLTSTELPAPSLLAAALGGETEAA